MRRALAQHRPLTTACAIAAALTASACSDPRSRTLGAFTAEVDDDGARLTLRHTSGLVLSTAPALASFAEATGAYETQYGAFFVTERRTRELPVVELSGFEDDTLVLRDAEGEPLGTLTLAEVQGSLQLTLSSERAGVTRAALSLACDTAADGGYLGFGAQTHDVDHRGQLVPIWVTEQGIGKTADDERPALFPLVGTRHSSYLPVASLVAPRAQHSFGLRSPTLERSVWDVCKTDPAALRVEAWERTLVLEVAPGPTPLDVLAQQTTRSGRAPLGPDWTFGVWMEAIGGRAAVLAEAAALRTAGIPASAIWAEDWRGGTTEGRSYVLEEDWRADDVLYPDLADMIAQLHAVDLKFMAYFNTFVVEDVDVWPEISAGGFLVQRPDGTPYLFDGVKFTTTGLLDLYNPRARAFMVGELQRAMALGVDGWMADFAEWYPAEARDVVAPAGFTASGAHNQYPVEWAKTNQEAVRASGRDDVVIFHRSGFQGSQPHTPVVWVGDQRTSFDADDGLPTVVPLMLGLSVTGFPVVTHDIAGYVSATNPPATKDLYYRWTTLGALSPIMRTHHGRDAALNWRWNSDDETRAHFARWSRFHQQHFPHWKGLALEAAESGAPILRPMAFADPGDVRLVGVRDQYMIGDDYLVAPVLTASVASRTVLLPRGTWYPLDTPLMPVEGPGEVTVATPLGKIAVFARAGAIVPLIDAELPSLVGERAQQLIDGARVVEVWLGADGRTRDARGGTWSLTSSTRPTTPFIQVDGGTDVRSEVLGQLRFSAAANGTVTLTDDGGSTHVLVASGHAPSLRVQYLVHY